MRLFHLVHLRLLIDAEALAVTLPGGYPQAPDSEQRKRPMQKTQDSAPAQQWLQRIRSRHLIVRAIAATFAAIVLVQAATIAVLTMVDMRRHRRSAPAAFPHSELPEISLEGNTFQILHLWA